MKSSAITVIATVSALVIAGCSGATEEEPVENVVVEAGEANPAESGALPSAPSTEAYEVCDADGNRYASDADAEAAGLERAEYGATYCEYAE